MKYNLLSSVALVISITTMQTAQPQVAELATSPYYFAGGFGVNLVAKEFGKWSTRHAINSSNPYSKALAIDVKYLISSILKTGTTQTYPFFPGAAQKTGHSFAAFDAGNKFQCLWEELTIFGDIGALWMQSHHPETHPKLATPYSQSLGSQDPFIIELWNDSTEALMHFASDPTSPLVTGISGALDSIYTIVSEAVNDPRTATVITINVLTSYMITKFTQSMGDVLAQRCAQAGLITANDPLQLNKIVSATLGILLGMWFIETILAPATNAITQAVGHDPQSEVNLWYDEKYEPMYKAAYLAGNKGPFAVEAIEKLAILLASTYAQMKLLVPQAKVKVQ